MRYWVLVDLVNVKAFNLKTRINEVKALVTYISCDCKCKFDSTTYDSNQKWNNDKCQCKFKKYCMWKKDYNWIPRKCVCEKSRYLKVH